MPGSFDEQVARLDPPLGDVARRFILVRLTNMRGLDLNLFDVDYDLNWHGLVVTPERAVLARFGGRDADTPGKHHSLAGLRYTLTKALERFERDNSPLPRVRGRGAFAEEYPAAGRLGSRSCIHCHHVREFQREQKRQAGTWTVADEWVYPEPAALGLTLDIEQGDRVAAVRPGLTAAAAGLKPGDVLRTVNGAPVASIMDVQHALHQAPARGKLSVTWQRDGQAHRGVIDLPDGWRRSDVSWRWSLKSLPPGPQVSGDDLSDSERRKLGIGPAQLAFRQNGFVPRAAQQAGLRVNDVVVGIDGRPLEMNARQFEAHVRLHFQVGQTVRYDVLRGGQRLSVPIKLQ
jgi:serine protease Do